MFYKGRLRVAGDDGDGIPVDLSLDDVYVDLRAAGGEELGRWRMDVVEVARLEGSDFQLVLDGEAMVFRASDPLGFAYNAVTTIEDISSRLRRRRRGLFRRKSDTPRIMRGAEPERVDQSEPRPMTEVSAERLADLRSLLPPEEPVELPPAGDDLFAEFAVEIEEDVAAVSYSTEDTQIDAGAATVDAGQVPQPDPEVEESVPFEPVGFDSHESIAGGEMTSDDQASVGAVEADEVVEMDLGTELEDEDMAVEAGVPDATEVAEPPVDLDEAPGQTPTIDAGDGETLADATGDVPGSTPEVVSDESAEELEAGAVPLEESVDESVVSDESAEELEVGAVPLEGSVDESVVSDGSAEETEPEPARSAPIAPGASTRAEASRKRRFFGRNRIDPEHDHQYDESRTVGGITRRVCAVCGHVSFAGEDLYEGWQ